MTAGNDVHLVPNPLYHKEFSRDNNIPIEHICVDPDFSKKNWLACRNRI